MFDVVTFGETMIRLAAPSFRRLEQCTTLDVTVGGAEQNVATGIARLGLRSSWVSRLPDNSLGRMARNKAAEFGVDTSHVIWTSEGRMGLYFVEYGAAPRASSVLYDREYSTISQVRPGEVDWDAVLSGCKLFHTTGITPALSASAAEAVSEAMHAAKRNGCLVSYDLNYRGKLWSSDEARRVQEPLMNMVDILVTTEEDTETVFGVVAPSYAEVAKKLIDRFGFEIVTVTLRSTPSVWRNTWSAIAVDKTGKEYDDVTYDIEVVDRVGGGDAYTAGFLYGYLTKGIGDGVRYGNAFSALKQTSWGDFNWATRSEVEKLMKSPGLRITR
jgi:2-dehydro-3-deoxygluconokinase